MRSEVRLNVVGFLLSRLVLFFLGAMAVVRFPIDPHEAKAFHLAPQSHTYLEAWARYDACWYVTIAERGYGGTVGPFGDMRANFFPLYPSIVRWAMRLTRPPLLAALMVSNICYFVFLLFLWRLVSIDWTRDVARRTVWIYLLFPSAFFLSGAYSESLLLAVTTGSFLAARRRFWFVAGALAALAALARPVGVWTVVPVLAELIAWWRTNRAEDFARSLAQVLIPVGMACLGYLVFALVTFGAPLAAFNSQASIRGPIGFPWQPFIDLLSSVPRFHAFDSSLVDAALALIAVVTLPLIFKRVRLSYALYAVGVLLIPLSGSLVSFSRLLLPSFPHAILLAICLRREQIAAATWVALGILEAIALTAFATWHWVA